MTDRGPGMGMGAQNGGWIRAAVLAFFFATPAFGSFVSANTSVSLLTGTFNDGPHFGDSGTSSISMADIRVDVDGGVNYGANAFSSGTFGKFSLLTFAGGSATGFFVGTAHAGAVAQIQFSDSVNIAGVGQGKLRLPFLVDGSVSVSGSAASAFGFTFCQAVPHVSGVGSTCLVNGLPAFFNQLPPNVSFSNTTQPGFAQLFNLDFPIVFGQFVDLNFTVTLTSGANGASGIAGADFSHTGTIQAAQVFDQFGNLIPNPTITSDSGFDYVNPQFAASAPEPGGLILAAASLLLIVRRTRKP